MKRTLVFAAASAACFTLPAGADDLKFCEVSGGGWGAGITAFWTPGSDGGACLTLSNQGRFDSVLVGVYLDTDESAPILGEATIISGEGVLFEPGGSPGELPGAGALDPEFESSLYFTAVEPDPRNGVDFGELLTICFALPSDVSMTDVEAQMASGQIRVGVRLIAGDDAASLVSQRCPADFNCDWSLDINDFIAFRQAFMSGDIRADFDANGKLDIRDFIAFHGAFHECLGE